MSKVKTVHEVEPINPDDGVIWKLPPVTENENFYSESNQIPTFLTKLGDYREILEFFGEGENLMIGVADTGAPSAHIKSGGELEGAIARDFTNSQSGSEDIHGHASHVACHIVGRKLTGLAPKADIRLAKVLGDNGSGSSTAIANGIDWLVSEIESSGKQGIINLSLGGGYSSTIEAAIKRAVAKNVIVFAAMGNSGGGPNDERGGYPGRLKETFGIVARDYNERVASFSSRSADADLSGYGVNVLSCGRNLGQYRRLSGTSMATPCEVGIASLIIGKLKDLGRDIKTKEEYFEFVKPFIRDLGSVGRDREYGFGAIDLLAVKRHLEEGDVVDPVDPKPCPPSKIITKKIRPRRVNRLEMKWFNSKGVVEKTSVDERVIVYVEDVTEEIIENGVKKIHRSEHIVDLTDEFDEYPSENYLTDYEI